MNKNVIKVKMLSSSCWEFTKIDLIPEENCLAYAEKFFNTPKDELTVYEYYGEPIISTGHPFKGEFCERTARDYLFFTDYHTNRVINESWYDQF
ncbi:MAG: hypothetical protein J5614_08720 [Paludibacteraceae bacterium]|nr:hypothetical protein [Paludibacteraceae bacterium]